MTVDIDDVAASSDTVLHNRREKPDPHTEEFLPQIDELNRTLNGVRPLILSMAPIFEAEITPVLKTREMLKLAQLAEEVGVDRLGISDVIFYPDTYELHQSLYKTSCGNCCSGINTR
jgi:hypothetical protein